MHLTISGHHRMRIIYEISHQEQSKYSVFTEELPYGCFPPTRIHI